MSEITAQDEPEKQGEVSDASNASGNTSAVPPVSAPPPAKLQLSGDIVFNENITVYAGTRIPHYDRGPVKAYAARGSGGVRGARRQRIPAGE